MTSFVFCLQVSAQQIQLEHAGGPFGGRIAALGSDNNGTTIYVGTEIAGIYASDDSGQSFALLANSVQFQNPKKLLTDSLGSLLVLGYDQQVHQTTNQGIGWSTLGNNLFGIHDIAFDSNRVLYAGCDSGLYVFNGSNNNWEQVGVDTFSVTSIGFEPQGAVIISTVQGIYRSTNTGQSWTFLGFAFFTPSLIAVNSVGDIFLGGYGLGTYRSTNHGTSWTTLTFPVDITYQSSLQVDRTNNSVYVASTAAGILRSTDNGDNWSIVNNGLDFTYGIVYYLKLYVDPQGKLWTGTTGGGTYLSVNHGDNWHRASLINSEVSSLAILSDYVFAATWTNGVFRSPDNGNTWQDVNSGIPTESIFSLGVAPNGKVFAGTYAFGLYRSNDSGSTWQHLTNGLPDSTSIYRDIRSIAFDSSGNSYVGGYNGVFLSTNVGDTWTRQSTGLPGGQAVNALAVINHEIVLAGLWNGKLFQSSDSGSHWIQSNPSTNWSYISDISIDGNNNIYVGTGYDGVYRSTNSGGSWHQVNEGLGSLKVTSIYAFKNQELFATTFDGGLFHSTNSGQNWYRLADSVLPTRTQGIVVNKTGKLFIGSWGYGAFRSTGTVLDVQDKKQDFPLSFTLFQNYPNPANPETRIKFSIGHHSHVSLTIYNLLGQEVEKFFDGELEAGEHTISWNTTRVSSGVYYYRLQAVGSSQTRKLLVIK